MTGVLIKTNTGWMVQPRDLEQPSLPVLQSIRGYAEEEPTVELVEGKLVDYEVTTIATGTSEEGVMDMDVAKLTTSTYIYESPDGGKTVYRRLFGDYNNKQLLN